MANALGGEVIGADDAGYEQARAIFNSMIDRRPALIAQCDSADDVAAALAFARVNELEVAIRGGGHSVTGASLTEGGLVIDMRRMSSVTVDPAARTATAQGGTTWSDFDRATQPHGLMSTGGRVSSTRVAGLTLGGGSGWLERKFGFACDSLSGSGRARRTTPGRSPGLGARAPTRGRTRPARSVYLNFDSESEDHVEAGFGRENYERLAAVKAEYDPDNVFHLHHNVKPLQPA